MEEDQEIFIPVEIIITIFKFMDPETLMKCRYVSKRWKNIVDSIYEQDIDWRGFCKKNFPSAIESAALKSSSNMDWFDIYRNLSLWSKVSRADITLHLIYYLNNTSQILGIEVIEDGILAVHTRKLIRFIDLNTREVSNRYSDVTGQYTRYARNSNAELCHGTNSSLHFSKYLAKEPQDQNAKRTILYYSPFSTFDYVDFFVLTKEDLYFVCFRREVYHVDLNGITLSPEHLAICPDDIRAMDFSMGLLHVYTVEGNIYSLVRREWVHMAKVSIPLAAVVGNIYLLPHYNFIYSNGVLLILQYLDGAQQCWEFPQVTALLQYGDHIIIGTRWGKLLVYHHPQEMPITELRISEPEIDLYVDEGSIESVVKIDVFETEKGHEIIVALEHKIFIIEFNHFSGRVRKERLAVAYDADTRNGSPERSIMNTS